MVSHEQAEPHAGMLRRWYNAGEPRNARVGDPWMCDYCGHSRHYHERDGNGKLTTTGHCSARVWLDGDERQVSGSCSCESFREGKE